MKKKILSMLIGLALILSSLPAVAFETYGSFSYVTENGEITITGSDKTEGYLSIPSRIDGTPVTGIASFAFSFGGYSDVVLPYTLKTIGSGAFLGCAGIKAVSIPGNVVSVGDNAFGECSSLKTATVSASVEIMGIDVFAGCSEDFVLKGYDGTAAEKYAEEYGYTFESLGEAEDLSKASGICGENAKWKLSNSGTLTIYGEGATGTSDAENNYWWDYKEEIKSVIIEEGITTVFSKAFQEMPVLEAVTLPDGLIEIGEYAFDGCEKIRSILIPSTVTTIGYCAFRECVRMQSIVLPDSVTSVGGEAFYGCKEIKAVKFSANLKELGISAFTNCFELREVKLPETLEVVPANCFSACNSLSSVIIPEGVKTLGRSSFSSCPIEKINIPVTVTTIDAMAFDSTVVIAGYDGTAAEKYATENGNTFESLGLAPDMILSSGEWGENISWAIDTAGRLIISGEGEPNQGNYDEYPWYNEGYSEIVIKEGVTAVAQNMFYKSPAEKVSFPSSLREIRTLGFNNCKNLTSLDIPEGVITIGNNAFSSCFALTEAHIPSTVININGTSQHPFSGCPSTMTLYVYEGSAAEYVAQLRNLNYVSSPIEEKTVITEAYDENIYYSISNKCKLKVWAEAPTVLEGYIQYPWRNNSTICSVEVGKNITSLGQYAFYKYARLSEITLSEYVTEIKNSVFGTPDGEVTVKGYEGTVAESFAQTNGYNFVSKGEAPSVIIEEGSFEYSEGTWKIDSTGVLTLEGKGIIEDYQPLWSSSRYTYIKKIVIGEGINFINYGLVYELTNLEEAVLPASLIKIDDVLFPSTTLIHVYDGSVAEEWAKECGYICVSRGALPDITVSQGSCGNDTVYTLTADGLLTVSGDGYASDMPWSQFKKAVRKIKVESGITGFATNAFSELDNLKEAEFSQDMSVTSMGNLFYYCKALEKVVMPPVEVLEGYFFQNCTALKKIELPETLIRLARYSIYGCSALKEVYVPSSVESIVSSAFIGCGTNYKITGYEGTYAQEFAESYGIEFNSLGRLALKEPVSGESENISWVLSTDGVMTVTGSGEMHVGTYGETIWDKYRSYIEKLVIGEGVTTVGAGNFMNCENLTSVEFPSTLESIGSEAFMNCVGLTDIVLPDGLIFISSFAFENCESLEEVTIPASVTEMDYSFYNCYDFVIKGYTGSAAEKYATEEGISFVSLGTVPVKVIASGTDGGNLAWELNNLGELTISGEGTMASFTSEAAPWSEYEVKSLTVCDGVLSIGTNAFAEMYSLENVSLPEGLVKIGAFAFSGCEMMKMVYLPDSVTNIGMGAFINCWYGVVTGPNVKIVGEGAFENIRVYGYPGGAVEAHALEEGSCTFYPVNDSGSCGENATWSFDIYTGILEIKGRGRMNEYPDVEWEGSAPWYNYRGDIKSVKVCEGITYIGEGAFHFLMTPQITLPSTLKGIGAYSFDMSNFAEIIIPEGCTVIGEGAFQWNDNLSKLVIPASVAVIGSEAFAECDNLVIYVYEGSYALSVVKDLGIPYEVMKLPPTLYEVFAVYEGGGVTIAADGINLEDYKGYAAIIGENGAMEGFAELKFENGMLTGSAEAKNPKTVKCFIWSSLSEMKPLCKPVSCQVVAVPEEAEVSE